ncbi:MAG: hypothetical protein F6J93_23090 [Oscillatoria sp. SIO1A7]|nr:hypothetical protein [Oscillatoria sp. SIO1A7]
MTEIYTSSDTNLAIPDENTLLSTVSIADSGTILDLNVQLGISHDRSNDLDVFLKAPDGTSVKLFASVGGNGNNLQDLTLDDDASHPISAASNPNITTFRPEENLALFNGLSLSGVWTLEVRDTRKQKIGTLDRWSLEVKYLT